MHGALKFFSSSVIPFVAFAYQLLQLDLKVKRIIECQKATNNDNLWENYENEEQDYDSDDSVRMQIVNIQRRISRLLMVLVISVLCA